MCEKVRRHSPSSCPGGTLNGFVRSQSSASGRCVQRTAGAPRRSPGPGSASGLRSAGLYGAISRRAYTCRALSLYVDVIRYPDLFLNIFRRELHGKYRGSVLGLFWTLLNPLALIAVYTLVFSVLLKAFSIENYPLFVVSGLVTWVFFQSAVQMACSSLFAQPMLVKQVRFPRHMLPLAVVATNIVTLGAMLAITIAINLIVIPETRTTFWAAIPLLVPLIALASGLAVVVRLPDGCLPGCRAPDDHDLPALVLHHADLLHTRSAPRARGERVGRGSHLLRQLRDAVRRGDPRSHLLRRVSRPGRRRLLRRGRASSRSMLGVLVARRMDDQVSATL